MNTNPNKDEESSELFEHYRFEVDPGQSPLRLDKFLMLRIENASRNKIQNAIKAGNVRVNEQEIKSSYKVRPADTISIVMEHPRREVEIFPQDIPIEVVFEDKDIMLINKEPDMVVHPGHANYEGTLLNAIAFHLEHHSKTPNKEKRAYLVHRIDKDTSGLILAAKSELAQSKLGYQFFHHTVKRNYHALVWGDFEEDEGRIEGHIGRDLKDRRRMYVYEDGSYGKEAVTHYKVIRRFGYVSLVECQLETGRTHQIRAHFKHIKHPLFNDATYGGDVILKGTTFSKYKQFIENCFRIMPRQALHAKSLGFVHPGTGKEMNFESELPADMQGVLEKWDIYTRYRTPDN
ncbi:MAG: RluA family pseudouridine synthase [Bacteroidota bacterium]|nr:RluA family pseudouridine synthase [Bacteroidota bacterium]